MAVATINGWVIEAQMEPDAVIAVPLTSFVDRYPELLAFSATSEDLLLKVAEAAIEFVGLPYRRVASLFPRWRRPMLGENCVSVARKAVAVATGKDPGWRRPDHAVAMTRGNSYHKIDYARWVKPESWFTGMVVNKEVVRNLTPESAGCADWYFP